MANQIFQVFFILFCLLISSKQVPVSDKLDFDESSKEPEPKVTRLSLLCGSDGCNTTDNSDSIQTEVLVHVKTKVNINKTDSSEKNTSDVPIFVGYRGSQLDETTNEEQFRNFPNFIDDRRDDIVHHTRTEPIFRNVPDFVANRGEGNDYVFKPQFGSFRPTNHGNTFHRTFNRFNGNWLEHPFPHFEHTYNRHYFGEAPPPHSLLYPKIFPQNPVAFNGISRSQWKPVYRPNKYNFDNHFRSHDISKCTCEDGSTQLQSRSSIDDKLAPLQ